MRSDGPSPHDSLGLSGESSTLPPLDVNVPPSEWQFGPKSVCPPATIVFLSVTVPASAWMLPPNPSPVPPVLLPAMVELSRVVAGAMPVLACCTPPPRALSVPLLTLELFATVLSTTVSVPDELKSPPPKVEPPGPVVLTELPATVTRVRVALVPDSTASPPPAALLLEISTLLPTMAESVSLKAPACTTTPPPSPEAVRSPPVIVTPLIVVVPAVTRITRLPAEPCSTVARAPPPTTVTLLFNTSALPVSR